MIELTDEQRQELSAPEPVAIDPRTRQTYVLVRRETYERLKALLALDDCTWLALGEAWVGREQGGEPLAKRVADIVERGRHLLLAGLQHAQDHPLRLRPRLRPVAAPHLPVDHRGANGLLRTVVRRRDAAVRQERKPLLRVDPQVSRQPRVARV